MAVGSWDKEAFSFVDACCHFWGKDDNVPGSGLKLQISKFKETLKLRDITGCCSRC
jgi:hypothetical protein